MNNWACGFMAITAVGIFAGCAVDTMDDVAAEGDENEQVAQSEEAVTMTPPRSEYQKKIDGYIKTYGQNGLACQTNSAGTKCLSLSADKPWPQGSEATSSPTHRSTCAQRKRTAPV